MYTTQRGYSTTKPIKMFSICERKQILRDMLEIGNSATRSKWNISIRTLGHIKYHHKDLLEQVEDENMQTYFNKQQ